MREPANNLRDPVTRVVWIVLAGLAGLVGWWSWSAHARAERAEAQLAAAQRAWRGLTLSDPVPTKSVARAWRTRREALQQRLRRGGVALGGDDRSEADQAPTPTQRAEAFFALAQFVEAQRAAAAQAGVTVPAGGYAFGFSAYANSGPADEELEVVHRQQIVAQALLELLWRSGSRELTRVQREVPAEKLGGADRATARGQRREGRPEDYLQLSPSRSLDRIGWVDTIAMRIGFIGKTATLRWYLNQLADLPLPLVVRAVEVEPLGADGTARGGVRTLADLFRDDSEPEVEPGETDGAAVPIIRANEAEFLVTVEYLDFAVAWEAGAP